jgi:hypothetical protein
MPFGWHQPNGMCPCAMRLLQPAEIDHQRRDVAGAQAYDEDVGVDAQVLMPGLARRELGDQAGRRRLGFQSALHTSQRCRGLQGLPESR